MADNPNFPRNLDIRPSRGPGAVETTCGMYGVGLRVLSSGDTVDTRFHYAAQKDAIRSYGIAGRVWEASYAMMAYLDADTIHKQTFDPPPFTQWDSPKPAVVIELGSGIGLVTARMAERLQSPEHVLIATDLPEVCPLLQSNLGRYPNVWVRPLPWGEREDAARLAADLALHDLAPLGSGRFPTHIICSDLVYFPALLAPLLRTLLHITSAPFLDKTPAQIIISYKIRSLVKETPFWSAFGLWFTFDPVFVQRDGGPWTRFVPVAGDDETFVFVAHRKPESSQWSVPEDNQELLAGMGAYGTSEGKADDTFESLLFLGMDITEI